MNPFSTSPAWEGTVIFRRGADKSGRDRNCQSAVTTEIKLDKASRTGPDVSMVG